MAVPSLRFDPPYDVHLLRGQKITLMTLLMAGTQDISSYLAEAAHALYTIRFSAFFDGSPAGNAYTSAPLGLTLDTHTGDLTASAGPTRIINNFIVKAILADNAAVNPTTSEAIIRVQVHTSIAEAWLTPNTLSVQREINGFKFSIRARFDDNVVGEIGEIHRGSNDGAILYAYDPPLNIAWASPVANLITPGGEITPSASVLDGPHPVTATITGAGQNVTANGFIRVDYQLQDGYPHMKASLVTTANCPGFARADEVPNIIFLPDGFTSGESAIFDTLVDDYISDLSTGKISSPFNILNGSINYWKIFLQSRERGGTNRGEVYIKEIESKFMAKDLFLPEKPASAPWDFTHLYYHVGLPVKADKNIANADLKARWKLDSVLSDAEVNAIPDSAIDEWKGTAERRLPEEMDTVLGITINNHTSASLDKKHGFVNFNSKRVNRSRLEGFFKSLKDTNGNHIGLKFTEGTPTTPQGKDFENVVVVSAGVRGREINSLGVLFVVMREEPYRVEINENLNSTKATFKFSNDLKKISPLKKAVLTHEISHSFGLGDEYGDHPLNTASVGKFINDPAVQSEPFRLFDNDERSETDRYGNIQAGHDLLSPNPNLPGTGMIDVDKLKWRYHRISKCGIVAGNPVLNGTTYTIPMRAGHGSRFAQNDKVFLRKRVSVKFMLVQFDIPILQMPITNATVDLNTLLGLALTVVSVDLPNNTVEVRKPDNSTCNITVNLITFPFTIGEDVRILQSYTGEAIATLTRTASPTPATTSDTITYAVSIELNVSQAPAANEIKVQSVTAGLTLPANFMTLAPGEVMILYSPVAAPSSVADATYKYAEVISKKVLNYLKTTPFPFNAKPDPAHANTITEIIDDNPVQDSTIPSSLVPCCSSKEKEIIGLYSGGKRYHGNVYHPAGRCFMRVQFHGDEYDTFCAVCRYILVDIIDPGKHPQLDEEIGKRKIYPT